MSTGDAAMVNHRISLVKEDPQVPLKQVGLLKCWDLLGIRNSDEVYAILSRAIVRNVYESHFIVSKITCF